MSDTSAPVVATVVAPEEVAAPAAPEIPAATPPAPETPAVEDKLAGKFAALSRQEKAFKAQQRKFEADRKAFEAERAKLQGTPNVDTGKYIDIEAFKKSPQKYIRDNGLTLEQVAQSFLDEDSTEVKIAQTEAKWEARVKQLEDKLAAKETADEAAKREADEAKVLNEFNNKLVSFVNDTPDYEMIRAEDAIGLVSEVIGTHYEQQVAAYVEENGEEPDFKTKQSYIMDNKQACDLVEKHLLEKEKARISKLRSLTKTKSLFETAAKPEQSKVSAQATNTLTNTLSTQVPTSVTKTLTDDESKREAAKLIKFID